MRIDRMLTITILLLSRERVSAKELAERFEVSVRTVYRDIEAINVAGIPIISHQGVDGGFSIMEGFKLDRQIFTTQDMISILYPLIGINRTFNSESIRQVIDKIQALIPHNEKQHINSSLDRVLVDIDPWGINEEWKQTYENLHRAIEQQYKVEITYIDGEGDRTTRILEPMTLIFKSYTWYLWGYCIKRSDYRLFKLSRVKECKLLHEHFIRKEKSYEQVPFSGTEIELKLKGKLSFLPRALEIFTPESISQSNENIFITTKMPPGSWLKDFIFSFGSKLQIIEPEWLREEIKKELNESLSLYT